MPSFLRVSPIWRMYKRKRTGPMIDSWAQQFYAGLDHGDQGPIYIVLAPS